MGTVPILKCNNTNYNRLSNQVDVKFRKFKHGYGYVFLLYTPNKGLHPR